MTSEIVKNLKLGIEAARSGNNESAQNYLEAVLAQSPDNIPALFWMAFVASSPQESIALLERVLELEPDNERAKAGLAWAQQRIEVGQPEHDHESGSEPVSNQPDKGEDEPEMPDEFIREQLFADEELQERAQKGALAHRARRTIDPTLAMMIVLGATALLVTGIWALVFVPPDTLAAWLPGVSSPVSIQDDVPSAVATDDAAQNNDASVPEAPTVIIKNFDSQSDTIAFDIAAIEAAAENNVDRLAPRLPQTPAIESEALSAPDIPVQENQPNLTPVDLIGPSRDTLNGPRLFAPVDEDLLAHTPASPDEKWIEVDLAEQRITAWEGNVPVMSFLTSTGLPNTPTVVGEYNIYWKLESTLMTGPGYYLPDVPYTMYFYGGYALHGAYWHDNFGQPMSHGCVNLSIDNSKKLFEWADPVIPAGQVQVTASADNPGTLVVVHQ